MSLVLNFSGTSVVLCISQGLSCHVTYTSPSFDVLPSADCCVQFCAYFIKMKRPEKVELFPDGLLRYTYYLLFESNIIQVHFYFYLFIYCFCVLVMQLFVLKYVRSLKHGHYGTRNYLEETKMVRNDLGPLFILVQVFLSFWGTTEVMEMLCTPQVLLGKKISQLI